MEIIRADHSGFCFGVEKAIDKTFEQIDRAKKDCRTTYTCGNLIHNSAVIDKVASMGVKTISSLDEAKEGDVVIVRSHGEPKEFYDQAELKNIELIDTTCVFVTKIHNLVLSAHKDGRPVIIIGSANHQEVKATNGWCDYAGIILENEEKAEQFVNNFNSDKIPLIVCQTTIKRELLDSILRVFDEKSFKYEIKNTICNATRDRQESCAKLSEKVDVMVVIGDPNSSNSKKLYEIAKKTCKNALFIQDISDLELKELGNYNKIGITAGASTPEWIIKEVIASMSENVTANVDHNPMLDYMDDIENSLRLPRPGEIVDGTVHQVMDNEVIVNIGCKKDGILLENEVSLEPGQTLADLFKEGDEIQAKVMKSDDGEGGILLSKKRLEMNENFKELAAAQTNKEIISVKLVKSVNSGVIAAYKEISGFIPLSQLSDRYVENADEFLGQTVDVEVIKVDNKRNRAVFSRKAVLVDEKRKQVAEIWANLNVGDVVEGKVMRFTDYGAFVDIGGVDGLLHISEISWGKLKHPKEVLNIGDIINVKILALNEEKGKISLGLKQTQPEPWSLVGSKYEIGQIIEGKVVQIKDYGAFVELEAGLDGLVHISEIANRRVENVSDELELGDSITAKIMEIDADRKRISLSIKALLGDEETETEAEATEE
ncbi:bifunctional 4-hydroxy-3-methylbut-2-enyl diphosphate reductase/30S ribosomal protein S1 [Mogibacterium neglectum]|uniref:bifunctional 4-hydroxy-3-methylbut-2-enyl diphosphate reductase/30S ribosomal protein S1 n=1 Tax=Mogibacterium neglectum TaxID=114528 RepID=UPI00272AA65A|nr:bifunctional 4-hydroxy-3-methylbut-2-enyl diphosphate reductase/30S ribosomal protein S1 [Mogibacterium neglectum]WLD75577.1 bifunctional 4-hydroxy-3-methylbut-2-enyl diphosphate reductase/30S ribosomal protein S1 [Mogibacterium neglectum]